MQKEASEKIIDIQEAVTLRHSYREQGKVVGCLSGSFDVISAVHFKALYERAKRCDVLFVLLNSDTSVASYKGLGKPFLHQDERSYVVAQSVSVDHVLIFDELTPIEVLKDIKPDIYFNVSEWGTDCVEREVVESNGGTVVLFDFTIPDTWTKSSSDLVRVVTEKSSIESFKAVFLDRDGVINANRNGYTHTWDEFEFLPGVIEAMQLLMKQNYKIIIVTNQSGIGRGYYTEADVKELHEQMATYLNEQGIKIDGIYYCPHIPEAGCECRKPNIALFQKAAGDHNVNLSKSWFVGDSESDVTAGRMLNIKTIYVGASDSSSFAYQPNQKAADLLAATENVILKTSISNLQ